jgi:hypothetical protein
MQSVLCRAARRSGLGEGQGADRRDGWQKTHWTEPLAGWSAMGFVWLSGAETARRVLGVRRIESDERVGGGVRSWEAASRRRG